MMEERDRTFEENVWDEEEREGDVVLDAIHSQVFNHAFDLCVADIGSVDVSLYASGQLCPQNNFIRYRWHLP